MNSCFVNGHILLFSHFTAEESSPWASAALPESSLRPSLQWTYKKSGRKIRIRKRDSGHPNESYHLIHLTSLPQHIDHITFPPPLTWLDGVHVLPARGQRQRDHDALNARARRVQTESAKKRRKECKNVGCGFKKSVFRS